METASGVVLFVIALIGYNLLLKEIRRAGASHEAIVKISLRTPDGNKWGMGLPEKQEVLEKKVILPIQPSTGMRFNVGFSDRRPEIKVIEVGDMVEGYSAVLFCEHIVAEEEFDEMLELYKDGGWRGLLG